MHNKGEILNGIDYTGKVSFKLRRKGKEYSLPIKNAGTKFLRDLICKALKGESIIQDVPRYLNFIYYKVDDSSPHSLLYSPVLIDNKFYGEAAGTTETESALCLRALIAFSDILSQVNLRTMNNISKVQLTLETSPKGTSQQGDILAYLEDIYDGEKWLSDNLVTLYESINGNTEKVGETGTDALIEWRMIFRNGVV